MTFQVAPDLIEQSDFDGGYAPDTDTTGTEANILPDMLNLLPDPGGSDALVTRKGFARVAEEVTSGSHYIKHLWPYRADGTNYLMLVLSDDSTNANNVKVYAMDLSDFSFDRIDTPSRTWLHSDRPHWGMTIQNVFYGGSPGNDVYSWDGTTWDATANEGSFDEVVDGISPGAGEKARDYAFKGNETVVYGSGLFTPAKGIRFPKWQDDETYAVGERVSLKIAVGGETYWRSYRCTTAHLSATATNRPGDGSDWRDVWQKVRLPLPQNEDGDTSPKWYFVPTAPGSSVAQWHADRFWIRYDGQGDKSRVLYSAPVHPKKGQDVPDTVFNMTDFQPGNDIKGPGGGWLEFNDGRQEGVVEAMWSYGQYLIVFKRQATFVLSGASEDTFTVRRLSRHVGAVSPQSVVELDSLVYVLSDDGLYVTDGTAIEKVPGMERFEDTYTARIDAMHAEGAAGDLREAVMWRWDHMLWFALPCAGQTEEELTFVYDPRRQAFFKTNLPVLAVSTARDEGIPHFYFSAPESYNSNALLVYEYDHEDATVDLFNVDDTGDGTQAFQDIPWLARTAWWPFGVARQQRRIRRVWAVVKGVMTFTIDAFRDWAESSAAESTARAVSSTNPIHIEGEWFADSHAVQFKVSGTKAPAALYGIAVDTQRRRERYHVA